MGEIFACVLDKEFPLLEVKKKKKNLPQLKSQLKTVLSNKVKSFKKKIQYTPSHLKRWKEK